MNIINTSIVHMLSVKDSSSRFLAAVYHKEDIDFIAERINDAFIDVLYVEKCNIGYDVYIRLNVECEDIKEVLE